MGIPVKYVCRLASSMPAGSLEDTDFHQVSIAASGRLSICREETGHFGMSSENGTEPVRRLVHEGVPRARSIWVLDILSIPKTPEIDIRAGNELAHDVRRPSHYCLLLLWPSVSASGLSIPPGFSASARPGVPIVRSDPNPCPRFLFGSAPRVERPVGLSQVFPVNVGVDLGCSDTRVAEHFLDRPQVCPAFEQMRGERVA